MNRVYFDKLYLLLFSKKKHVEIIHTVVKIKIFVFLGNYIKYGFIIPNTIMLEFYEINHRL